MFDVNAAPGSDLYEIREAIRDLAESAGDLGKLLMDPTPGDRSIHPEVRALIAGSADAICGSVKYLIGIVIGSSGHSRGLFTEENVKSTPVPPEPPAKVKELNGNGRF